jgi:hypothetical protein
VNEGNNGITQDMDFQIIVFNIQILLKIDINYYKNHDTNITGFFAGGAVLLF